MSVPSAARGGGRASRLALAPLLVLLSGDPLGAEAETSGVESELRAHAQELLDAVAPGNVEVWRRLLDDRMLQMDENGIVRTKAQILAELSPLPPGLVGTIAIDQFRVELHGDTAVAAVEIQEHLDYHGQVLRTRFRMLDTWRKGPDGWRLVGQHVAAVLKDPPTIVLSPEELSAYEGIYELTQEIRTTLRATDDGLVSERTGRPPVTYRPEARDLFFVPGQPRSRRLFTRDATGKVDGFLDRREGEDIRWRCIASVHPITIKD